MDPVIVVGAGISGVACARTLVAAGVPVRLLDRGRRIGGRMASRRFDGRPVDTGASYLTASDDRFAAQVERWHAAGLARAWTDSFTVLSADDEPTSKSGPTRWGTPGGVSTLVEDLAAGLDLAPGEVTHVRYDGGWRVDDEPASAVVLAMPDPQARRLLAADLTAEHALLDRAFDPVLALVATFAERTWDGLAEGRFEGAFVNGDDDLDWIADDGRRRGDDAPVLVAHSTSDRAARHLDDPASAEPALSSALRRVLRLEAEPTHTHVHRWSMAKPAGEREASFALTDRLMGFCGDGWGPQPKVEGAYLSGVALGDELAARLT